MEPKRTYRTIASIAEGLYKEKGSKFIAYALPCQDESEAKATLDQWRKEHPQACHICFAYRFGINQDKYRYSDDGEPANTAGPPIFGQIQSHDLTNILIGVIRYYGGTKLGVGGLIKAYRMAASDALDRAEIIIKDIRHQLHLEFNYDVMVPVMALVKRFGLTPVHQNFDSICELTLAVDLSQAPDFIAQARAIDALTLNDLGIK